MADSHPYRSMLYMPGSNARALEKAKSLPADALILDLEDAVAPSEKEAARALVCETVRGGGYGDRRLIIRINALNTKWGEADLAAACAAKPEAILVPKVQSAADVHAVEALMRAASAPDDVAIWAMMETPLAMLSAGEIAFSSQRLKGFVVGTNDLAKDLNAAHTPDRLPLITGLGLCLLAAKAYGLICMDGVYNAFRDEEGLRAACVQGKQMGFDGKTVIHPAQIEITNEVFAPQPDEVELARRQVEAYESALKRGEAVAVVEGRIVENLHAETARRMIGMAEAINRNLAPGQ